jgi:tyrosine-protein kinase Etk/Wzc
MLDESNHINASDAIDFNKLNVIIRNNWIWIALILLSTNCASYLYVRYTKDLYESISVIKLDVKQDATELGMPQFGQDKRMDLISGEIETIQSRLFLTNVVDSLNLNIQYFSIGQLLNFELYNSCPFLVSFVTFNPALYDVSFHVQEKNDSQFELRIGEDGTPVLGSYNEPVPIDGCTLIISKKPGQKLQSSIHYSFINTSRDALMNYLANNLVVELLNFDAKTLKVSFKDNNPTKARDLVNGIDSLYLQYSNEQKNLANKQKIDWLANELQQIETKMGEYEDYFENFTLKNKTSDLKEDLKKTISQINKIDSQRFELTKRISEVNNVMDKIAVGDFYENSIFQNSLPASINKNIEGLKELYIGMDKMKLSYKETTLAYKRKENEIKSLHANVQTGLTGLKASYLAKLQDLNSAKKSLESAFIDMPDKNTQYNKNERFYKLYEELYLTLVKHKSEFEIVKAGSTPDFKLLSTATLPTVPIAPNKPIIYGMGLVAGIVAIVFLIGTLYLLNNKINSAYEIEKHSAIPMLGIVPKLRIQNGSTLYVLQHPTSMVTEAIRSLRTNLDFFSVNAPKKVIAISSTVAGEGKSFIAMNLGGVMALSRKKVVLLDLDMRKAQPHSPVEQNDLSKGISTILIRKNTWQDCVLKTPLDNFHVIPSGPQPPNPSELLLNGEFSALLEDLKTEYDFILMDTPPVGLVTDGIMAMKRADISIYVFRANYSKKDFLHNLTRILKVNKFTNVTTLLNALPSTQESYYGAGYYEESNRTPWPKSIFKRA